jgi:hypothetical protein
MSKADGRPSRFGNAAIAALAARLTERDRTVALDCYEHRVLTTEQLRRLHFPSSRRAIRRLDTLYRLRLLDRFRPTRPRGEGSSPYHWTLDEGGALVACEALGLERDQLQWRRQDATALARSSKLAHQLAVNEFFTRLAEEAAASGGRLQEWWGERRCLAALAGIVAPDGYAGLELPAERPLSLLLELDRATEEHERLHEKARRYAKALPRSDFEQPPLVLIAVPSNARAATLNRALADWPIAISAIVWTPAGSPLAALDAIRRSRPRPAAASGDRSRSDAPFPGPPPAPH